MIRFRLICGAAGSAPEITAGARAKKPAAKQGAAQKSSPRGVGATRKMPSGCGQEFESWFQNGAAYDQLHAAGQISCPECGSTSVDKALMAPSVTTTKGKRTSLRGGLRDGATEGAASDGAAAPASTAPAASQPLATLTPQQRAFVDAMRKVREHVLSTSENVGKKFAEEARKIHYEEDGHRSIHGEASLDEAQALAEEGIDVFPIPVLPDDRN